MTSFPQLTHDTPNTNEWCQLSELYGELSKWEGVLYRTSKWDAWFTLVPKTRLMLIFQTLYSSVTSMITTGVSHLVPRRSYQCVPATSSEGNLCVCTAAWLHRCAASKRSWGLAMTSVDANSAAANMMQVRLRHRDLVLPSHFVLHLIQRTARQSAS